MKPLILLGIALFLVSWPVAGSSQSKAAEILAEANSVRQRGDVNAAAKLFEKAVETATNEKNRDVEAEARHALGDYFARGAQYEPAEKHLKAALALYEQAGYVARAASTKSALGLNEFYKGNRDLAARYYQEAISDFMSLNDRSTVAQLHYSMTFFSKTPEERMEHIRVGLQLARESGNRKAEGLLLFSWAERSYQTDDFDIAFEQLFQARAIFEEIDDRFDLARVLTSLGRLYRVHGHPEQAIPVYRQAREMQTQAGDKPGVIQTLNSIGEALNRLGRHSEALPTFEEALGLAKETGSQLLIATIYNGLASTAAAPRMK